MFETLFKFPLESFAEGRLILSLPGWQMALALPLLFAAVLALLGYLWIRRGLAARDLAAIALLRSLSIAVILFALSRPLLEVTSETPQPGVVAILLDNSISMRLDGDGGARHEFIEREFDAANGALLGALRERFDTRLFAFGSESAVLDDAASLSFADGDSDLGQALAFARQSLRGEPLAGLVVVSDGATRQSARLEQELLALSAAGTPVYTVGLGPGSYPRDIELAGVRLPRSVLKGSLLNAELTIRQQGYDTGIVELRVEDDNRILHKQQLRLDNPIQRVLVPLSAEESGVRQLRFTLEPQPGEAIVENNGRSTVLSVERERRRLLYYEGEPRFELKFVRRAVADDRQLAVTGLVRTADAKYLRLGIESRKQLRDGFPTTREELFAYDAVILGSVESTLLSREQQEMLVEFVNRRGGSLLLLGGRHAFAEGGYRESPLNDLLPVVLEPQPRPDFTRRLRIEPTPAALAHPALRLDAEREKSNQRWSGLPPLTTVNPIREIRPGATLLLRGMASGEEPFVALAFQRFGRGKVVAFPLQNTWAWQLNRDIEPDDQTHETLWRQMLRWLVEDVPGRLDLTLSTQRTHTGGTVRLRGEILRPDFTPDDSAVAEAILISPKGVEKILPLSKNPGLRGVYEAEIMAEEAGDYLLQIEYLDGDRTRQSREVRFLASTEGDEYHGSEMNVALLSDIAERSGGRFFGASESRALPAAVEARQSGARVLQRHELWDMPILFFLLVMLLTAEWAWRRWRRLA